MLVEVVVLYSHTFFLLLSFGWLKSNQCYETCKLAICYMDPSPRVQIWPWNVDMEYWLGGVDETYDLVSIGKEDMLKLGREREMCHNIHEWIVDDKLSPNFQLRWWGKKVGSGHYGTQVLGSWFLGSSW